MVQHGLMGNGGDFLVNSPGGDVDGPMSPVGNNLGFELAKRSYDVFLSNTRGNKYSLNHTTLHPDKGRGLDCVISRC